MLHLVGIPCLMHVPLHPTIYPVSRGTSIPTFSSSESIYFYIFSSFVVRTFNPKHPKSSKILQRALFWKILPLQMGQHYYLVRRTGKCWIWKINENAQCGFEDEGMFPKVHRRILEDSGRFLARIPRGLGLWRIQEGSLPEYLGGGRGGVGFY